MTDDELVAALAARVRRAGTPESLVVEVEARLGYVLPPLLRRVYREVADGGFGPDQGLLAIGSAHGAADRLATDPGWPPKLLPFCDWGCAIWSALDCSVPRGLVVTVSEAGFHTQGHTLASWLTAWLEDVDLWAETMEPGESRAGINPFTKQPHAYSFAGRPRGTRWP